MTEQVLIPRMIRKRTVIDETTSSMNGRMTLETLIAMLVQARNAGVPGTSFVDLKYDEKIHTDGNGVTTLNLDWSETDSGVQLRLGEGAS